jgi:hypothetical protein
MPFKRIKVQKTSPSDLYLRTLCICVCLSVECTSANPASGSCYEHHAISSHLTYYLKKFARLPCLWTYELFSTCKSRKIWSWGLWRSVRRQNFKHICYTFKLILLCKVLTPVYTASVWNGAWDVSLLPIIENCNVHWLVGSNSYLALKQRFSTCILQ